MRVPISDDANTRKDISLLELRCRQDSVDNPHTQLRRVGRTLGADICRKIAKKVLVRGDCEHSGALNGIVFQSVEGAVRVLERKQLHAGMNGNFRRDLQKILAILARVVCDAADDALLVEKIVAERGDRAHVDAAENQRATLTKNVEGGGNDGSGRGEDDGGVELGGRCGERVAGPFAPRSSARR